MSDDPETRNVSVIYRPKHYVEDEESQKFYLGCYLTPPLGNTLPIINFTMTLTPWALIKVLDVVVSFDPWPGEIMGYTFWLVMKKNPKSVWTTACYMNGQPGNPTYGPSKRKFAVNGNTIPGLWILRLGQPQPGPAAPM